MNEESSLHIAKANMWLKNVLRSDIPTKQFVLSLNDEKPPAEKFVIVDLDDTHLLVQEAAVDMIKKRIADFMDENTFQRQA